MESGTEHNDSTSAVEDRDDCRVCVCVYATLSDGRRLDGRRGLRRSGYIHREMYLAICLTLYLSATDTDRASTPPPTSPTPTPHPLFIRAKFRLATMHRAPPCLRSPRLHQIVCVCLCRFILVHIHIFRSPFAVFDCVLAAPRPFSQSIYPHLCANALDENVTNAKCTRQEILFDVTHTREGASRTSANYLGNANK